MKKIGVIGGQTESINREFSKQNTGTLKKLVIGVVCSVCPTVLVTIASIFHGFVCGFRFWANFFAVLDFLIRFCGC